MRRLTVPVFLVLVLAGCGTPGAVSPTPTTVVALKSYEDPNFHFGFKYPSTWTVPKMGRETTLGGVRTYIVDVTIPNDQSHLQVTLDGQVTPFPAFQDGHCAPDPQGGNLTFCYRHAHVSSWPAMHIERLAKGVVDGTDTITNTGHRSYDVRIVTAIPPFSASTMNGYNQIVRTLHVPFS